MQMNSKLYLRIILLFNYITKENLFLNVDQSHVKHAASRFSVRKNIKKKDKESDTWYLRSRSHQFFIQKFHLLHYADST